MKIGDCLDGIRQQGDLKTLLSNQPPDQQIIRGTVLDGGITSETSEIFSRGDDCLSEGELDAIQLPGNQDSGIKIAKHADGLEFLDKRAFVSGNVEAGYGANFRVAERGHHGAQIIRPHANVAVVDDQHFILCLFHQTRELHDFVVGGGVSGYVDDTNSALRKIAFQFLDNRQDRLVTVSDGKKQLIIRIILPAVAREIIVGFVIQAANRLQIADGRSERQSWFRQLRMLKEPPRTKERKEIIDERYRGHAQEYVHRAMRRHEKPRDEASRQPISSIRGGRAGRRLQTIPGEQLGARYQAT